MIEIRYFARYRDLLDCAAESLAADASIATVQQLREHLCTRGERWQATLGDSRTLMALNQEICQADTAIKDGDEVAFFPPVTGG